MSYHAQSNSEGDLPGAPSYYLPVFVPGSFEYFNHQSQSTVADSRWYYEHPQWRQPQMYPQPTHDFAPPLLYGQPNIQNYHYRLPSNQYTLPAIVRPRQPKDFHSHPPPVQPIQRPGSQDQNRILAPPRKPRQTPYTLWVGHLPVHTSIVALKDHFSKGCTTTIDSVFLIDRTRCAFVNYRTQAAAADALLRFNASYFNDLQMVCRLRRGGGEGVLGTKQTAGIEAAQKKVPLSRCTSQESSDVDTVTTSPFSPLSDAKNESSRSSAPSLPSFTPPSSISPAIPSHKTPRFFIMKSLAIENLVQAVRDNHWATQKHNALMLNQAFQHSSAVYLIFSANRSGSYFGYARMLGNIGNDNSCSQPCDKNNNNDNVPLQSFPFPMTPSTDARASSAKTTAAQNYALILPHVESTLATATAPPGSITTDDHRGTVFWEADNPDSKASGQATGNEQEKDLVTLMKNVALDTEQGDLDCPFAITWESTKCVPFQFTRNLRNPWNRNLEIKVARDGQELETAVGMRLVKMFH